MRHTSFPQRCRVLLKVFCNISCYFARQYSGTFRRTGHLHFLFISRHKLLDPTGILGPEDERNTIFKTSETPQPITEHNIPEDLQRGSDLCSRPIEFRARNPAPVLHCSINKMVSFGVASLPIWETMFNFTIYVVDQQWLILII